MVGSTWGCARVEMSEPTCVHDGQRRQVGGSPWWPLCCRAALKRADASSIGALRIALNSVVLRLIISILLILAAAIRAALIYVVEA